MELPTERVSQTVFDELLHLARCEDACFVLLDYLEDTLTPDDAPSWSIISSLHESICLRMEFFVDHEKFEKLPF